MARTRRTEATIEENLKPRAVHALAELYVPHRVP